MQISREYRAHSGNYRKGGNSCKYIAVHNTGNTASARSEARYAQNNQHNSSYHYVLDGSECYQVLDDTDTAWAVGPWKGCTAYIRNNQSISIEVCSNGTAFTAAEKSQLRELVRLLMARHGIPASRVVRHWDCHSGRKDCPAFYAGSGNGAWSALHAYITSGDAREGDDMEAHEVWEYIYDGDETGQNTYNKLTEVYKELTRTDDVTGRGYHMRLRAHVEHAIAKENEMYERQPQIYELLQQVAERQHAIEAKLDKLLGAGDNQGAAS